MESRLIIVGANKNDVVLTDLLKKVLKIKPENVVLSWQYNNEKGVIVALGMDAVESVIGKSKEKISKLRGEFIVSENYQLMPTFSTNYAIRTEANLKLLAEDIEKAYKLLNGLELTAEPKKTNTTMITTYEGVEELVDYIKETGVCAFDYETTGLDIFSDDFAATMISFSFQHGSSYTIPIDHFQSPMEPKERLRSLKLLKVEIFNNHLIRKIGHNIKFDMHICRLYGLWPIRGRIDDSMLMAHLINEVDPVGLKVLVGKYVKKFANYEDALEKYNKNYSIIPLDELSQYAGIDTDVTFRLSTLFESYLLKDKPLYTLYRNLQIPALRVLEDMEYKGVLIDKDGLHDSIMETQRLLSEQELKMRGYDQVEAYEDHRMSEARKEAIETLQARKDKLTADLEAKGKTTNKTLETVEQKLTALKTGAEIPKYEPFNFGSPKQLTELLFESKKGFKFKLPKDNKGVTMKGTGKEVVTQLKDDSGFVNDLLIFRGVKIVLGTFLQGIYDKLDSKNKLHTQYKQLVASGRISSTAPNLQNLPSNSKLSDEVSKKVTSFVKKAFIVPEGYTFIQCIAEGERVLTDKGYIPIEEVSTSDNIILCNKPYKVLDSIYKGVSDCVEVVTSTGRKLKCTDNHLLMSVKGFKETKEFSIGDWVCIEATNTTDRIQYIDLECYLAGLIYGDGYYREGPSGYLIGIATGRDVEVLYPIIKSFFKTARQSTKGDVIISNKVHFKYFTKYYPKKNSHNLRVPEKIWRGTIEEIRSFLAGVLDSDGSYHSDRITISSVCEDWILDLQILANSIGSFGIIRRTERATNYSDNSIMYNLDIFSNESVMNFPKGFLPRKNNRRQKQFTQCRTEFVPYELVEEFKGKGVKSRFFTNGERKLRVTRESIRLLNDTDLSETLDYRYEQIVSIQPIGLCKVYDLTIDQVHAFSVNGVIVHNCDYSQAELRVVASFANETAMLTAYENDQDLHAVTAANMLKLTLEAFYELDKDTQKKWRTRAKAGNFGLLYGMSAGGFKDYARNNYGVELTDKEAEDTRKLFFQTYPNLLEYHATYIAKARKFGYVRTLFGRKRHTPDIHSSDNFKRSNDERVSINSPIQGTAGEFTIFALALLHNRLDPRVQIANSVHDSIILYCPDELLEETIDLLKLTCENLPTEQYFGKSLRIGMKVDIETSKTHWGDLKS